MIIVKTYFYLILLCLSLISNLALGIERIDFDKRLHTDNFEEFFAKKKFFEDSNFIKIGNNEYQIVKSLSEKFYDFYLDTQSLYLSSSDISLRLRKRYIKGVLEKHLLQLKKPAEGLNGAYSEQKTEIKDGVSINSEKQLIQFLLNEKKSSNNILNNLSKIVNIDNLVLIAEINQNRDRFYLVDQKNDIIVYTVSFDEVVANKDLKFAHTYLVEIELSEKIANKLSENEYDEKIKDIEYLSNTIFKSFNSIQNSKIEIAIKNLNILPNTKQTSLFRNIVLSLIFIFLFAFIYRKGLKT